MTKPAITYSRTGNNESLTILANGKLRTVTNNNPNFKKAVEAYKQKKYNVLINLLDIPTAIAKFSQGKVKIFDDSVTYNGAPIHNSLTERILEFMEGGFPIESLIAFFERVMKNPDENSRNQLYTYLERYKLPIDDEGYIYAYKCVRNDFLDKHSATVSYKVGQTPTLDRSKCDSNPNSACSSGLHFGNFDYVKSFGNSNNDKYILVKIDPADVTAVPHDCTYQKVRCCKMYVVSEVSADEVQGFETNYIHENKVAKSRPDVIKKTINMPARGPGGRFLPGNAPKRNKNGRFIKKN